MGEGTGHTPLGKRRFGRRKFEAPAVILSGFKYQFEKTAEVSEGGLLLKVQKNLDVSALVQVEFILPNRQFINALGEVIYKIESATGQLYVGVKFIKISEQVQNWIRQFVAETETQ